MHHRSLTPALSAIAFLMSVPAFAQGQNRDHSYHLPRLAPDTPGGPAAKLHVPQGSHIEEYRVNGQVYMVKVIPPKPFPPYYLVNRNGNGRFTRVPKNDAQRMSVPQWTLFRW